MQDLPQHSTTKSRHQGLDRLRGLVMVVMALDHTRDFFGGFGRPTHMPTTTAALFLTRWVTHFCAPVFIFLAGAGIFLHQQRNSTAKTSRFLWTRGLWLILLELTIIKMAWAPEPFYLFIPFGVIWVIGLSMLLMSLLIRLPYRAVWIVGLLVVLGHNTLDIFQVSKQGSLDWLWMFLHQRGLYTIGTRRLMIVYPLIPWFGVMALGYGMGAWLQKPQPQRRKQMLLTGLGLIAAFVLLRGLQLYGDPSPWTSQRSALFTFFSFLNTTKYPPSLQFLLMTLGPSLCLLAWMDRPTETPIERRLVVFGRVPFFFYIAHLYLLRISGVVCAVIVHGMQGLQPPPGPAGSPL